MKRLITLAVLSASLLSSTMPVHAEWLSENKWGIAAAGCAVASIATAIITHRTAASKTEKYKNKKNVLKRAELLITSGDEGSKANFCNDKLGLDHQTAETIKSSVRNNNLPEIDFLQQNNEAEQLEASQDQDGGNLFSLLFGCLGLYCLSVASDVNYK